LSAKRDKQAARRIFRRALARENTRHPREIVTDRLTSYPGALRGMKRAGELWRFARHRRVRWLNNLVEQDHRRIKRRTRPMLGFRSFRTARRTLAGVEALAMLTKGQVRAVPADDLPAQRAFVHRVFGVAGLWCMDQACERTDPNLVWVSGCGHSLGVPAPACG
ncbi:MAG TPA: DDE-type integrase/transposase/recombinase, partial [Geminicoccaceae bacterium]|nr:DDE-type integrase/transposase/recombinase [Geminicoccaceae bacterium]